MPLSPDNQRRESYAFYLKVQQMATSPECPARCAESLSWCLIACLPGSNGRGGREREGKKGGGGWEGAENMYLYVSNEGEQEWVGGLKLRVGHQGKAWSTNNYTQVTIEWPCESFNTIF